MMESNLETTRCHNFGRGRYRSRGQDRHPNIMVSQVLLFPSRRPGRILNWKTGNQHANDLFGDAIIYKDPGPTRILFQNVKGLSSTASCKDYKYFLSAMSSYSVDVDGMAETNTGWHHRHLQDEFKSCVKKQFQIGKSVFGYPCEEIDPLPVKESFQAGGSLQVVRGRLTTTVTQSPILDKSGLGRWCGFTFIGKSGQQFSVITGYRSCSGSILSASLGSTFHREYNYLRQQGVKSPHPRSSFLKDLSATVFQLQHQEHEILLMMDANATV
jgi:hypothetical protein